MRIIFIGNVDFSHHCLKEVIACGGDVVAIFTTRKNTFNVDYKHLGPLARQYRVPVHYIEDINTPKVERMIKRYKPDIIFCFGWSQMIKAHVLGIPPRGIIGAHPSLLPKNRGRHPIIWALALGLKESGLTFFKMSKFADAGDIVSQARFPISYRDDARTVYQKIKQLASRQIKAFMPRVKSGRLSLKKQRLYDGNVWRKRTADDGCIDWRMSSRSIYNLVRALTRPYVGAHCRYKGKDIKVWQVKEERVQLAHIEPGKVLWRRGRHITVKASDGAVTLCKHDFKTLPKKGEYIQ